MSIKEHLKKLAIKERCENDYLFFVRYFLKHRESSRFIVNWHHLLIADAISSVVEGKVKNIIINVAPGSSKTEMAVINFMAWSLIKNRWCRFLHVSYSDDLALTNSHKAKDLVESDEFQELWPMQIASDAKAKKRWNVMQGSKIAGGVYAVSLGGQITGFRAGRMVPEFCGAILIDDPLKPEDAFSKTKRDAANRKLLSTVKSRRANPNTPIIIIMQRLAENDCTGFIEKGNLGDDWKYIKIPAMIDDAYVKTLPEKLQKLVDSSTRQSVVVDENTGDKKEFFSYWPYKEPIDELIAMSKGGPDKDGSRMSRHVFSGQYQQNPVALGGNLIQGHWFIKYKILPRIKYRIIYADTASKTKEANDYSVFQCWGMGYDNKIYLIDQIRGKWEMHELRKRAKAFWAKHKALDDDDKWGTLRIVKVEDKSSGIGLIQDIKADEDGFPIKPIERHIDKLTRLLDAEPYIHDGFVCIPETAEFTNDYIAEFEAFTADDTHAFDDQVDPTCDAVKDMLSTLGNSIKKWEKLAQ